MSGITVKYEYIGDFNGTIDRYKIEIFEYLSFYYNYYILLLYFSKKNQKIISYLPNLSKYFVDLCT